MDELGRDTYVTPGWGEVPQSSILEQLVIFVGIPLGLAVVITFLVLLPSLARRGRK